uniref:SnoaL-like domain-containing protein n=1 Tax=Entomoneis paludosa TaxID=265537 RepID=A0A7S3DST8_9STRA|eukprot:CAMPEP_0172440096 /NCGR_PEP_ID=MMETSP1065-20121228/863_1 /TAXON_ID=265537 /ORGANISM="Amphiprora paludosa, Strain CCMP125" /LENGTH=146 /DNA_ID=CAMNT_0013188877 /DNA_START=66 /DNA_END=506 /DNA_ORIENTATION=-
MSKFLAIAEAYGPAMTKAMTEGDISDLKSLFVEEPVSVVLQTAEGEELGFTIGDAAAEDGGEVTMSWTEFQTLCAKDLASQDYQKSVSDCCGVLGDRFILETARLNQEGVAYLVAFYVVTCKDGKISMMEAFSFVDASSLVQKATK